MRAKLLDERDGHRTYSLVFEVGEEVVRTLLTFARETDLEGSYFTAIGAFQDVVLGWFDWQLKDYRPTRLSEQVEVVSFAGNIALSPTGEPGVHAHAVVARHDCSTCGGHLLEAHVRPTLEVILSESPVHLQRQYDHSVGMSTLS